jgi:hypothetical protein
MKTRRIIITIPDEDKLWLEGYSKVHQISIAEAIRQGIGQLKKSQQRQTYRRLVESTSGLWEMGEALQYQESMRAEWNDGT